LSLPNVKVDVVQLALPWLSSVLVPSRMLGPSPGFSWYKERLPVGVVPLAALTLAEIVTGCP
jgi:hypothetical protein